MSEVTTASILALTPSQQAFLAERAELNRQEPGFLKEVERRRKVAREFRSLLDEAGLLSGKVLTRDQLAKMIELQWRVHNLNAMTLVQLLGTYPYYRHFKSFKGDEQAFAAHMAEKRPAWREGSAGYPGADLTQLSQRFRDLLKADDKQLPAAMDAVLELPGVGGAFTSATLYLYKPEELPLVNSGSTGLFKQAGVLRFSKRQRAELTAAARSRYEIVKGSVKSRVPRLLGWMLLLQTVREMLGFDDFLSVDHFMWRLTRDTKPSVGEGGPNDEDVDEDRSGPDSRSVMDAIEEYLSTIDPKRLEIRKEAESQARELIANNLGRLTEDQIREVFRLLNVDYFDGKTRANRFSPAFVGSTVASAYDDLEVTNRWIQELWTAPHERVAEVLDNFWTAKELPGTGRSVPTGILYLRDPDRYSILIPTMGKGYAKLTRKPRPRQRKGTVYLSYALGTTELKETLGFPPQALDLVLWKALQLATAGQDDSVEHARSFAGFNDDSFRFMSELVANNNDAWFKANKERFVDNVRGPLKALVGDLGNGFIERVNPDLERAPKAPHTLSKIRKNIWGRKDTDAYWPHFWAAFHRVERSKTDDFQLHMFVHGNCFSYGMYFGSAREEDLNRLHSRLEQYSDDADRMIADIRKAELSFHGEESTGQFKDVAISTAAELSTALREDANLSAARVRPSSDPLLKSSDLTKDVEVTYEVVYPLFLLATSDTPVDDVEAYRELIQGPGNEEDEHPYPVEQLLEDTFLSPDRVKTLEDLLATKPQIIFYGPPGTGKTWLAERFARYLAGAGGEVKTIQFHPSYSYEDFVEGIRPTLEKASGQINYEVVPGVFWNFCEKARKAPQDRFVLIIDEINRGNLPRIFGELLYLLERRGDAADLPISGKPFRVPRNLYIIGTMNTADQSIALLDAALRRRFHFERFDPDPGLLREWLQLNRPNMERVADVLERLNVRLAKMGIDRDRMVGHSHFMVKGLSEERLEHAWTHSVFPTIEEFFYGRPESIDEFTFENFVEPAVGEDLAEVEEEEDTGA